MRKIYLTLLFLFSITFVMAQTPQKFNYQAVARNASGDVLENQNIGVRISVLNGSSSGTAVYVETHDVSTNQFGLFTLAIGGGNVSSGSFQSIDWAGGSKYLQVEFDPNGGTSYVDMGASQLLSVPYALHAGNSGVTAGAGISVAGGVVTNTAPDQTVSITGTGLANVTGTYPNFSINVAPLSFTAGSGIIISGNVISVVDTSVTNELQILSLSANNLTLSNGGGTVSLVPFLDNTDAQTLSLTGTTLSITGGNSLNLSAINTDSQTLAISGNNLSITGGNTISLPTLTEVDGSIINEIQTLSISGNTVSLTNGGSVVLPAEVDGSTTNEIQSLSLTGNNLSISGSNTIALPTLTEIDGSVTNEIQTISEIGNTDKRLKTNITPLQNSLEKVLQVNGYNYQWKPGLQKDTTNQIGFMAQEIETIFPELVKTDENGYKSVAYQNLVPVLVEALKEQQKQIDELKAQKEQATGHYEELNAKLETLTKMMLEMQGQTNGQK